MAEFQSTPDSRLYGLFGAAQAKSLADNADVGLSRMAIHMMAGQERANYDRALAQSQQAEFRQSQDANRAGLAGKYLDNADKLQKSGLAHLVNPDVGGYLDLDMPGVAQTDLVGLDNQVASGVKDRGDALLKFNEATGQRVSIPAAKSYMAGPLADSEYLPDFLSQVGKSKSEVESIKAEADAERARADTVKAAKYDGHDGGGDNGPKTQITYTADGTEVGRVVTYKDGGAPNKSEDDGKVAITYTPKSALNGKTARLPKQKADELVAQGKAVRN